jgi:hypothetical protein
MTQCLVLGPFKPMYSFFLLSACLEDLIRSLIEDLIVRTERHRASYCRFLQC